MEGEVAGLRVAFVFREIKKSSNTAYIPFIVDYFKEKGHEVTVFAQGCEFDLGYVKLPSFGRHVVLRELSTAMGSVLKVNRKKFDLIYSRAGTRYVFADICSFHFLFGEWGGKGLIPRIFSLSERLSFLIKQKYIISVSNLLKNAMMRNYGVPEEKIRVIHNGANTEIFNSGNRKTREAREMRKRYGKGGRIALFVGARPERKGLPYLLEAMKYVRNCRLVVAGLKAQDGLKFKNAARKLGIEEKVEFLGFVPHEKLKFLYAASDIFVLPTFFDPCAVSTLEAMASGCVPVDSVFNGSAELIENGVNGFKVREPRNAKEIAGYINLLTEDKNLFRKLQRNAIKTGEGRSFHVVAKEWEEYFREVCERLGRCP